MLTDGVQNILNIVIFSSIHWEFLWQRYQQITSRLVKRNCNVVFFQTPIYLTPSSLRANYEEENLFLLRKVTKTFHIANIFLLPFQEFKFLNFLSKNLGLLLFKIYLSYLNFKPDIAIFYSYKFAFLLNTLKSIKTKIIYDCIDDISEFPYFWERPNERAKVIKTENLLVSASDLIFVVSEKLKEKIINYGKRPILIRNGVDYEHFSKMMPVPEEIKEIPHPIIGYIGAISEWFDINLISKIAKKRPSWSFLFVGPIAKTLKFPKLSNIYSLGQKPYESLPAYLHHFDACIIPFKINNLTLSSNPVKMYEYMAAGKMIVSSDLPEVRKIPNTMIGHCADDFIHKIEEALNMAGRREIVEMNKRYAAENTWDRRIDEIIMHMKDILK